MKVWANEYVNLETQKTSRAGVICRVPNISRLSEIELDRRSSSDAILRAIAKPLGTTFEDLKEYDTKPTLDEIRRRVLIDPRLGFAFRRLFDENVSAEDLVNLADSKAKRTKKK